MICLYMLVTWIYFRVQKHAFFMVNNPKNLYHLLLNTLYMNKKWHVLILVNGSCQTKLSIGYVFSSWVYGGVGWWGLRVILVLSLSLGQVERFLIYFQCGYFDGTWCILNTPSGFLDTFPLHRLAIEMSCHIYDI